MPMCLCTKRADFNVVIFMTEERKSFKRLKYRHKTVPGSESVKVACQLINQSAQQTTAN